MSNVKWREFSRLCDCTFWLRRSLRDFRPHNDFKQSHRLEKNFLGKVCLSKYVCHSNIKFWEIKKMSCKIYRLHWNIEKLSNGVISKGILHNTSPLLPFRSVSGHSSPNQKNTNEKLNFRITSTTKEHPIKVLLSTFIIIIANTLQFRHQISKLQLRNNGVSEV